MNTYPRNGTVDLFEEMTGYRIDTDERLCACAACPFASWRVVAPVVEGLKMRSRQNRVSHSEDPWREIVCHCTLLNVETMRSPWAQNGGEWAVQDSSEVVSLCSSRELEILALAAAENEA